MSRAVGLMLVLGLSSLACEKPTNIIMEPRQPVLTKRSDQMQLVARVMHGRFEDAKATVHWSSQDPNIVTVSDRGVIKGVNSGMTNVTAESDGITASAPVEVRFVEKITAVDKVEMKYEDEQFDPQVVVTTYSGIVLKDQPMFDSQDDKICRVDRNGHLHPGNAGSTVITAHLDGKSITIPCTVAPEEKPGKRKKK